MCHHFGFCLTVDVRDVAVVTRVASDMVPLFLVCTMSEKCFFLLSTTNRGRRRKVEGNRYPGRGTSEALASENNRLLKEDLIRFSVCLRCCPWEFVSQCHLVARPSCARCGSGLHDRFRTVWIGPVECRWGLRLGVGGRGSRMESFKVLALDGTAPIWLAVSVASCLRDLQIVHRASGHFSLLEPMPFTVHPLREVARQTPRCTRSQLPVVRRGEHARKFAQHSASLEPALKQARSSPVEVGTHS
jgi:hypothetical protein